MLCVSARQGDSKIARERPFLWDLQSRLGESVTLPGSPAASFTFLFHCFAKPNLHTEQGRRECQHIGASQRQRGKRLRYNSWKLLDGNNIFLQSLRALWFYKTSHCIALISQVFAAEPADTLHSIYYQCVCLQRQPASQSQTEKRKDWNMDWF